jgi:GntR family transcriptional regulator/MocR family aminotransferase
MRAEKIQLAGRFQIDRSSAEPLSSQIVHYLLLAIRRGWVGPGAKLPSTRALAGALGVSRNTVIAAYDELKSMGCVRGRRGGGIHVAAAVRVRSVKDPDGNLLRISR